MNNNSSREKMDKEQSQNSVKGELNPQGFKKIFVLSVVFVVLLSAIFGGIAGFLAGGSLGGEIDEYFSQNGRKIQENQEQPDPEQKAQLSLREEDSAVVDAVKQASPAVVSIIVTKDVPKLDDFFNDPFSNDPFFNPFGSRQERQQPETERREIGGGTGFIIDKNGHILTNRHVVSDEQADYTVMTNDGEELKAEVLARDQFLDMAFLKVEAKEDLPTIEMGDSDKLEIGQTVIAIGNSLGEFRNTVSKGIVSGLKRNIEAGNQLGRTEALEEVIQTDAAINPGNSGGPLLDLSGQAVGVNVAMAQGAENIGFSIPINQVKDIYQSVKEEGRIIRPYLGVRYVLINEKIQEANNLPVDHGALVIRGEQVGQLAVVPGSPADKAGIEENNIILEVDGRKITEKNGLADIIRKKDVGDKVKLKVWQKGETQEMEATLEESNL
ncbi:MAG: trypsin-like peptidase domain-containing protein [Candidatus Moranbacteria bacterium]|nr:trypsin-like peptidase domain-containing protein [Candidatus Moranbacteria bacterium]